MEGAGGYQPRHSNVSQNAASTREKVVMQGYPNNPQGEVGYTANAGGLPGGPNRLQTPDAQPTGYGLTADQGEMPSGGDQAPLRGTVRDYSQRFIYGVPSFSH